MPVIYRITNMANGKYYIGSAESFERRKWQHIYDLKRGAHKNPRLQAAWNKYGADMFVFEVLETLADSESVFDAENRYLHQCVGQSDCYNINIDAHKPRLGKKHTAETKAKIAANRVPPAGEKHYRFGQTLTVEVRAKISAAQKGRANPRKGQAMSAEGRANVSAAVKRGEDSHFYGTRPVNADALQREVVAVLPDRTQRRFVSLSSMRDSLGVSIATIIRACKSGMPIKTGACAGWVLAYADAQIDAPQIPDEYLQVPRSRSQAKAEGAAHYFTGIACERGHISLRSTKGTCVACRREDDKVRNDVKRAVK